MKMLLKALSGLLARLLRPAPNPYGLTISQKKLKAEIDAAVRHGATAIFCVPRRSGATYLAHIFHAEHGGLVVVQNRRTGRPLLPRAFAQVRGKTRCRVRRAGGAQSPRADRTRVDGRLPHLPHQ